MRLVVLRKLWKLQKLTSVGRTIDKVQQFGLNTIIFLKTMFLNVICYKLNSYFIHDVIKYHLDKKMSSCVTGYILQQK